MSTTIGYIGTTERAALIRAALKKEHGWTGRDVSVRADHYSMGSAIRISIKNPDVPLAAVKAIAEPHEDISYDQFSGEILSGGNRFVTINYAHEACETLTERRLPQVREAIAKLTEASDNSLFPVPGTDYLIGRGQHGWGFSLWQDHGHKAEVNDERAAALYIAIGGWNH